MDTFNFYQKLGSRHPGSVVFTSSYITPLPLDRHSTIADLGCGYGGRATWIARSRCCAMHVFDSSPQYLDHTYARSEEGGAENQFELHIIEDGYQSLPVPEQSYDLIMSEGLSFQFNTLKYVPSWIPYMKPGGAITITLPGVVKSQASDEVTHRLNAQRDEPISTLEDYHEQIMALDGVKFVHQATLGQHSWDEYYQDLGRCLKSLIKLGELQPSDEVARAAQDELDWYRNYARGQVFLQAFVLSVES